MIKSKLKVNLKKDENQKGIWRYSPYLVPIEARFKLSLDEGKTEELELEKDLFLKREDENPTGSLKDRGMAFLVSWAFSQNLKDLVISSSGNAAISAAAYCRLAVLSLNVFVSPKINPGKEKKLRELGVKAHTSPRPVSEAIKYTSQTQSFNLRPSKNQFGPEGFQTISFELLENLGPVEDIFIPVSSGVSLLGIAQGFAKLGFFPRLHACQSTAVNPIASAFTQDFVPEKESLAQALVARSNPLKDQLIKTIKNSQGTGWVVSNQEIVKAQETLEKKGIKTSEEGALALAAFYKARHQGWKLGKTVCLLTGKKY